MTGPERVVVRPRVLTRVCWVIAVTVVVLFGVIAVALGGGPAGDAQFRLLDQLAFFGLGILIALGPLAFTRARVEADATGIRVRNAWGEKALPWQVVRAVQLVDGTPWATLDLHDDDTVSLLAVQAGDGESAVQAVLDLRALLAASR
ncbi:MAG: PH domain-containing protein [Mycobacteriales bacterium]